VESAGYEELTHTADWAVRVWAMDLAGLFAESARGMNALMGARLAEGPRRNRIFEAEGPDTESLLVAFLSELVYCAEHERAGFDRFDVQIYKCGDAQALSIEIEMEGAPLVSVNKTIKAVTYHGLKIQQTARGYEVEIVFDV